MAFTKQATSHYLNQWALSPLTHLCDTRAEWSNCRRHFFQQGPEKSQTLIFNQGEKFKEILSSMNRDFNLGSNSSWDLCKFKVITMMTSSNENIFRVTGHLCVEFTGHRWIPRTKASGAELWCFLWSAPEWTIEQTTVRLVIWDSIMPIMTSQ